MCAGDGSQNLRLGRHRPSENAGHRHSRWLSQHLMHAATLASAAPSFAKNPRSLLGWGSFDYLGTRTRDPDRSQPAVPERKNRAEDERLDRHTLPLVGTVLHHRLHKAGCKDNKRDGRDTRRQVERSSTDRTHHGPGNRDQEHRV